MNKIRYFLLFVIMMGCRQSYLPPISATNHTFLVIEGYIDAGTDSTQIRLTRTISFGDTSAIATELNALVTIEGDGGYVGQVLEKGNGYYESSPLALPINQQYRLKIQTSDNDIFASEYSSIVTPPAIDSISVSVAPDGATLYVNTQDTSSAPRYYRWDFLETWEYRSSTKVGTVSVLIYANGQMRTRLPPEQIYRCWQTTKSTNIIINSSEKLSHDIIYKQPLLFIPISSTKIGFAYSMLVSQYGLDRNAFLYWDNLSRNTENLGSVFDAQPSLVTGNIHCITHPETLVLGYISVTSASKKRIVFQRADLRYPETPLPTPDCEKAVSVSKDQFYNFFSTDQPLYYIPLYYSGWPVLPVDTNIVIGTLPICSDCRFYNGTNIKPGYMP
ncbi:MAG TPA: DUF4249 domain-containing protein [Puia sp.]